MTAPEIDPVICTGCNGSGEVDTRAMVGGNERGYDTRRECADCNGCGWIESPVPLRLGPPLADDLA